MPKVMLVRFDPTPEERKLLEELERLIDHYLAHEDDSGTLLDFPEWLEERFPDLAERFDIAPLGGVYRKGQIPLPKD